MRFDSSLSGKMVVYFGIWYQVYQVRCSFITGLSDEAYVLWYQVCRLVFNLLRYQVYQARCKCILISSLSTYSC